MEANALANEDFCTFDLSKRIRVVPEDLGFKVLSAAMELDAEIRLTEQPRKPQPGLRQNPASVERTLVEYLSGEPSFLHCVVIVARAPVCERMCSVCMCLGQYYRGLNSYPCFLGAP